MDYVKVSGKSLCKTDKTIGYILISEIKDILNNIMVRPSLCTCMYMHLAQKSLGQYLSLKKKQI